MAKKTGLTDAEMDAIVAPEPIARGISDEEMAAITAPERLESKGLLSRSKEFGNRGLLGRLKEDYGQPMIMPGGIINAPAQVEKWLGESALRRIGFQGAQGLVPNKFEENGAQGGTTSGLIGAGTQAALEAIPLVGKLAAKAAPPIVSVLTGAPKEAVSRLIARPKQVLGMSKGEPALPLARQAQDELLARNEIESKAIRDARNKFATERGSEVVDTSPIAQGNREFRESFKPTEQGIGAVSPQDLSELSDIEKRGLTTVSKQSDPMLPQYGVETVLPKKSAKDLQRLADYIDSKVKDFDQKKTPGSGDTRYQSYLRSLYGKVKGALHELDPEGLGAADKRFSQYATDVEHLGKLENPAQMESFINNFYGPSKGIVRESTEKLLPKSVESIKDLGSSRAFTKQGPSGSSQGVRRMGGLLGAAALGGASAYSQDPEYLGLAAIALAATNPTFMRSLVGKTTLKGQALNKKIMEMSTQNPAAMASILQQFQPSKQETPKGLLNE